MNSKIKQLVKTSKKVILDCCLENGAIVAGNPGNSGYLKDTPNYFYVWPRDSAFTCVALDILGMKKQVEKFFKWCSNRACDKEGLLWQHYAPNGLPTGFFISELYNNKEIKKFEKYIHPNAVYPISKSIRSQLQPDGDGLLLWALEHHIKYNKKAKDEFGELANCLANSICKIWSETNYKYLINDPWEEKIGYPGVNLTYTIATSIYGLSAADKLYGKKKIWTKTKESMEKTIQKAFDKNGNISAVFGPKYTQKNYKKLFSKMFSVGKFNPEIDASLFSVIWPAKLTNIKNQKNMLKTLIEKLDKKGGIIRYPGDSYDGIFIEGSSFRKGGNAWPLLNFWAAICLNKTGRTKEALKYYNWVLNRTDKYIPEQIDNKNMHKGPSPLIWSHAMFIIASKELGFL